MRPLDILRWFTGDDARIRRAAGAPVLATVPVRNDGLMPEPPSEPFLEGLRFLRAAIQMLPDKPRPRHLVVCPVGAAPAAQDVALYLAHSFAEAGKSVKFMVPAQGHVMPARKGQWMDRVEVVPVAPGPTSTMPDRAEGGYVVEYLAAAAGQGVRTMLAARWNHSGTNCAATT